MEEARARRTFQAEGAVRGRALRRERRGARLKSAKGGREAEAVGVRAEGGAHGGHLGVYSERSTLAVQSASCHDTPG